MGKSEFPDESSISRREFLSTIARWSLALSSLGVLTQVLPGCGYQNTTAATTTSTTSTTTTSSSTTTTTLPDGYFHSGTYYV